MQGSDGQLQHQWIGTLAELADLPASPCRTWSVCRVASTALTKSELSQRRCTSALSEVQTSGPVNAAALAVAHDSTARNRSWWHSAGSCTPALRICPSESSIVTSCLISMFGTSGIAIAARLERLDANAAPLPMPMWAALPWLICPHLCTWQACSTAGVKQAQQDGDARVCVKAAPSCKPSLLRHHSCDSWCRQLSRAPAVMLHDSHRCPTSACCT